MSLNWTEQQAQEILEAQYRKIGRLVTKATVPEKPKPAPIPKPRMNKTETRYALHLEHLRRTGQIASYHFERLTIRLAEHTRYTPDFLVVLPGGRQEIHEVKGAHVYEDSWIKFKISAEMNPWWRFVWAQWKDAEWSFKSIEVGEWKR